MSRGPLQRPLEYTGDEDCTCREAMYDNIDCFVGYRSDAEAKAEGASMYAQVPVKKRNRSRAT